MCAIWSGNVMRDAMEALPVGSYVYFRLEVEETPVETCRKVMAY